ncbi:terminase small subunit [bacterium]|nr:terminase small subunit [bacterium]
MTIFEANILRVLNIMDKLTPQQKKFVTEYLKNLDGETAAKNAGYKDKNLKQTAENLLSKDTVIRELNRQLNNQIRTLRVQKGYVVKKLLQIAEFSLEEEDILDKEGNMTGKKKLRDTSAALKALDSLCKYLFLKDDNSSHLEAKIITISNLNDKKI